MEIRNNTPSFGMAFRKPEPSQMEVFTKYLTGDFKMSSRLAKRGLAQVVDKHANDAHFDIYFNDNKVSAIPKSDKARSMQQEERLTIQGVGKSVIERYKNKYSSDSYKESYRAASSTKRFFMDLGQLFDSLKTRLTIELRPQEILPVDLRKASENVENWEKLVKAEVSKEATEAVKAAKKAEKIKQVKAKALEDISSVFEPNVKSKKPKDGLDVGE